MSAYPSISATLTLYGKLIPARIKHDWIAPRNSGGSWGVSHWIDHERSGAYLFRNGDEAQVVLRIFVPCVGYSFDSHHLGDRYGLATWPFMKLREYKMGDEPPTRMCKRCEALLEKERATHPLITLT